MCRALINIAKGLNIDVIITGIEDQQQFQQFASLRAEGLYISTRRPFAINAAVMLGCLPQQIR